MGWFSEKGQRTEKEEARDWIEEEKKKLRPTFDFLVKGSFWMEHIEAKHKLFKIDRSVSVLVKNGKHSIDEKCLLFGCGCYFVFFLKFFFFGGLFQMKSEGENLLLLLLLL